MFICQFCGKSAPEGTRCVLVTVETKEIKHPYRHNAHKFIRDDGKTEYYPDEGGVGMQISKEKKACIHCAEKQKTLQQLLN